MRNKHVLFHRYTPWQGEIRCSTNIYAEQFIQAGYGVSYMSALVHMGRLLKSSKSVEALRFDRGGYTFKPLVTIPFTKKGPTSSPFFADLSYQSFVPSLKRILKKGHGDPGVIWTVPPGSSALAKIFPKAKLIMQVVDYYPAFQGERIKQIEKRDYERADHIFSIGGAITEYLVDELKIDQSKITTLGQGVDYERYQQDYEEPLDIQGLPEPRAIWVGLVSKGDRIMFEEVARVMNELNGSFIIIGPLCDWAQELANTYSSVKNVGAKMSAEIPAYLRYCDVGIMLYDRNKHEVYKGQHPLKLYEYAAAGLTILSTPHDEYKYLQGPFQVVEDESQLENLIRANLERLEVNAEESKVFAQKYTWQKAFEKVELTLKMKEIL